MSGDGSNGRPLEYKRIKDIMQEDVKNWRKELSNIKQEHKDRREAELTCMCANVEFGSYDNQVVLAVPEGLTIRANSPEQEVKKAVAVDTCIAREVQSLWRAGIVTTGCCCGHNKGSQYPYIGVAEEHIPYMQQLGYKVQPNPNFPEREDSFVPKSIQVLDCHTRVIETLEELREKIQHENIRTVNELINAKLEKYEKGDRNAE